MHARPVNQDAVLLACPCTQSDNGTETLIALKLWRPDFLAGALEVNAGMSIVKADLPSGLIFGVPFVALASARLHQYVRVAKSASLMELMHHGKVGVVHEA